jgi:hypothetical protein
MLKMTATDFPTEQELIALRQEAIKKLNDADAQWLQELQTHIIKNVKAVAGISVAREYTHKFGDTSISLSDLKRRCSLIKTWMDQTKMAYTLTETANHIFILSISLDFLPKPEAQPVDATQVKPASEAEKMEGERNKTREYLDKTISLIIDPDHPMIHARAPSAHKNSQGEWNEDDKIWISSYITYLKKKFICAVAEYRLKSHVRSPNALVDNCHVVFDDSNGKRMHFTQGWVQGLSVAALGNKNKDLKYCIYRSQRTGFFHLLFEVDETFVTVTNHFVTHW